VCSSKQWTQQHKGRCVFMFPQMNLHEPSSENLLMTAVTPLRGGVGPFACASPWIPTLGIFYSLLKRLGRVSSFTAASPFTATLHRSAGQHRVSAARLAVKSNWFHWALDKWRWLVARRLPAELSAAGLIAASEAGSLPAVATSHGLWLTAAAAEEPRGHDAAAAAAAEDGPGTRCCCGATVTRRGGGGGGGGGATLTQPLLLRGHGDVAPLTGSGWEPAIVFRLYLLLSPD